MMRKMKQWNGIRKIETRLMNLKAITKRLINTFRNSIESKRN